LDKADQKKLLVTVILSILILSSIPLFAFQHYATGASTPIFTEGFETGNFNAWTGQGSVNTGVVSSVQSATAYSASYAMKVAIADGHSESGNCRYKDLGGTYTALNARVYLQISASPVVGSVLEVLGFSSDGWLPNAVGTRVDIVNVNSVAQWRVNYYNGGWQSAYVGSISAGT
jgi:hypothetical protein